VQSEIASSDVLNKRPVIKHSIISVERKPALMIDAEDTI